MKGKGKRRISSERGGESLFRMSSSSTLSPPLGCYYKREKRRVSRKRRSVLDLERHLSYYHSSALSASRPPCGRGRGETCIEGGEVLLFLLHYHVEGKKGGNLFQDDRLHRWPISPPFYCLSRTESCRQSTPRIYEAEKRHSGGKKNVTMGKERGATAGNRSRIGMNSYTTLSILYICSGPEKRG